MFETIALVLLFSSSIAGYQAIYGQNYGQNPVTESSNSSTALSDEECVRKIYKECNRQTVFSYEELETVRQYLNRQFTVLADIKPDKPLCPKLHVRQDWKCLSPKQKNRVIYTWKVLYRKGVIQRLADTHVKYWPSWHKTAEWLPGHRWMSYQLEKHMREIDPHITLPYWDPYTYGANPELSSIWETLGHSGNYSNGYSVPDGIYAHWDLVPTIKRHWSPDGTFGAWLTQEFSTIWIQNSNSISDLGYILFGYHFQPHLQIGGYEGQYSIRSAPYDVLFHMHHSSILDIAVLKWQLMNKEFLTPLSYSVDNTPRLNPKTGKPDKNDIHIDILTGVPDFRVKELFWVGFGDLCYIPDQLVRPINNLVKNIKDPVPSAVKRLPKAIIDKYFPAFKSGQFSELFHTLEESMECNAKCLPLPKPTLLSETEQGRRQLEAFRFDEGIDLKPFIEASEQEYLKIWTDLNAAGYCSPYVTPKLNVPVQNNNYY